MSLRTVVGNSKAAAAIVLASSVSAAPLRVQREGPGASAYVPCRFDGVETECFLDTGSNATILPAAEPWSGYAASGRGRFQGASGAVQGCDAVEIGALDVAGARTERAGVLRCAETPHGAVVGLDAFRGRVVRLGLASSSLDVVAAIPDGLTAGPLTDNSRALFVPVTLGGGESLAMLDTGASLSVVDAEYVRARPELFRPTDHVRAGGDSTGARMSARSYALRELAVGGRTIRDVLVVAVDFAPMRGVMPPGSVLVLGYNVLGGHDWYLDLARGRWAIG